jgi:hypothetical protein
MFEFDKKGTLLIENTEGKFALVHKETVGAPRELRWRSLGEIHRPAERPIK